MPTPVPTAPAPVRTRLPARMRLPLPQPARERRAIRIDPWRLAPIAAAAAAAGVYLLLAPRTTDLAAHVFRAELFGKEGFAVWNGQWYGGHHTPAYSVLFPPLAWLLGVQALGVISAVSAAALFEPLVRFRFGERARVGAIWFGAATATNLFTGRLPFALGIACALGALLALQRGRTVTAPVLAATTSLASPVAGVFLALAAAAAALTSRRRAGGLVVAAALVPPAILGAAFPEGGYMPFPFSSFAPIPLFAAAFAWALPRRERTLRAAALLYALGGVAAFALHTPMGSNAVRLGALAGGPLIACGLPARRRAQRPLVAALLLALLVWQWSPAVRDVHRALDEPSARASYYQPLLRFLAHQRPERGRVEIPFSRSHWEAAEVGIRFPLARGWERQLDTRRDPLFYGGILDDFTYANWLAEHAVQFVALPDVKPDYSSYVERGLIERGPPYLRLIRRLHHWRVYEVTLPHPMVIPSYGAEMRLVHIGSDALTLRVRRPGPALVRVRWTPYWRASQGCVEQAGDWTQVIARRPGELRLKARFSLVRMFDRGRRCAENPG